jgi:peptidyl-prolyl cis-trans isomerase D
MLSFLRKYSGHWIIGIILFIIALAFVISYGYGGFSSGPTQEIAKVNGQPILSRDWAKQFNDLVNQYQKMSKGELTEKMVKAMRLKEMARDRLIDETLLLQAADRQGLQVSDRELQEKIQSYPFFQRGGRFDKNLYFRQLSRARLSIPEFEASERRHLEIKKIIGEIFSLAKGSDAELQQTYHLGKDAVKVSYLLVTPDKFIDKQTAGDAEISRYYQEHQAEFRQPARARVSYLLFRTEDFLDRVKILPADVEDFIKEHQAEYLRPKVIRVSQIFLALPPQAGPKEKESLSKQAQELLKKLQGGEDFAQAAKAHSQDAASKDKGGDLGYVSRGQHPPEWDRVAFGLKTGQVGRADTPQGIYLLKVEEVKETERIPGAEAQVTQRLKQERARTMAQDAAQEGLSALAKDTAAVAAVAKKYGISLKETPLISSKDQVPGLGAVPAFNLAALKLKTGEVSRVVNLPAGCVVMKSLEYQPERLPPLEQVKDRVAQQVKKQKASKEAEQEAAGLLARLKKGEPLDKVAAAAGLPVKESDFFTRFEGFEKQQQAQALTTGAFLLSPRHPYIEAPIPWQGNFYLLAFKEQRPASEAAFQKNLAQMKAQFLKQKEEALFQSWLDAERRRAKIVVYALPGG